MCKEDRILDNLVADVIWKMALRIGVSFSQTVGGIP